MGFGEANQQKNVVIVNFENGNKTISEISIPVFQKLESIIGDREFISNRLKQLKEDHESVWTEIIYDGNEIFVDFAAWIAEQTVDTKIEVLISRNNPYLDSVLTREDVTKSLEELDEFDVFDKLLEKTNISIEQKEELKNLYREIKD